MRITEENLSDRLHEFIDNCEPAKLAELTEVAFGGDCVLWYDCSNDPDGEIVYTFDPNEKYRGELGESEFMVDDLEEV